MIGNTLSIGRARSFALLPALMTFALAGSAFAEPSSGEKAAAEALFQKGVELMAAGKAVEACEKFDGSQQLDPALGTILRLADCYERTGKTASAWALFQQAAATATAQGQSERNKIAAERANSVAQRLSRVQLTVDTRAGKEGLLVKLNGKAIPAASWDAALPVDPGLQTIEVSAPGYLSWKTTVVAAAGPSTANVEVPALKPEPLQEPKAAGPGVGVEPVTAPERSERSNTQSVVGYVVGGVGIVGLALGGVFAYRAYDKNQQSLDQCRKGEPNACTEDGAALRKSAQSSGTIATAATIAGGALVATGITLLISAPSRRETAHGSARPRTSAILSPSGVFVQGEF
jgi:serine/threonine-protein kinase